ncbi:MAG: hypothetical protein WC053_01205 [Sideroxydans sp.]|jgi:hypothetical protein
MQFPRIVTSRANIAYNARQKFLCIWCWNHNFDPNQIYISGDKELEIIYYTLIAGALYLLSNWILERMEIKRGKRFPYRSLVFFFIMMAMVLITFGLLNTFLLAPTE